MTTNIYDFHAGMIGSDSRWSIETPSKSIIYVDDSGYEKIAHIGNYAFLFAGNVMVIHAWKMYLHERSQGLPAARPPLAGCAFLAVELSSCEILEEYGQDIGPVDAETGRKVASFAGTGSFHAHKCWRQNKCVKTAVRSAVADDYFSGLPLKYLNLKNAGDKDCASVLDLEVLRNSFLTKGMVMKPSTIKAPIPLLEAAVNDPEIAKCRDDIANGKATIQAPCDAMYNQPTAEDERKVDAMLERMFGP